MEAREDVDVIDFHTAKIETRSKPLTDHWLPHLLRKYLLRIVFWAVIVAADSAAVEFILNHSDYSFSTKSVVIGVMRTMNILLLWGFLKFFPKKTDKSNCN